jgi:hypothetical protein
MVYAFDVERLKQGLHFMFGVIDESNFKPREGIQDAAFTHVYAGRIWEEDMGEWWNPKEGGYHGPGIIITIDSANTGTDKVVVFKRFLNELFTM